jgi:hypothetical protein
MNSNNNNNNQKEDNGYFYLIGTAEFYSRTILEVMQLLEDQNYASNQDHFLASMFLLSIKQNIYYVFQEIEQFVSRIKNQFEDDNQKLIYNDFDDNTKEVACNFGLFNARIDYVKENVIKKNVLSFAAAEVNEIEKYIKYLK